MELKKIIEKNLFFKVDLDTKYKKKKGEKIKQDVKFFLVGLLPVFIEYTKKKKQERSVINIPVEVESDESVKYLRLLHGARYSYLPKIRREIKKKFKVKIDYKEEVEAVVEKALGALNYVAESGKFRGKKINRILILNTDEKKKKIG
jgi:hypothetical protein